MIAGGHARIGILVAYGFNGFALAAWSVRLPSIQADLGIDAAQVGVFLTSGAAGTLAAITTAGWVVASWGARRCYMLATLAFVVAYGVLAASLAIGSYGLLVLGGALHGGAFALTNIPQSLLSAACERKVGRTILPQFHACYSIGAAGGAALGGVGAAAGLTTTMQFVVLAGLACLIRTTVAHLIRPLDSEISPRSDRVEMLQAEDIDDTAGIPLPAPGWLHRLGWDVWRDGQIIALGVLMVVTALSESSANNWSAIALVDGFDAAESRAALALTAFLVTQTVARLVGGSIVDRVGRVPSLLGSFACMSAGVGLFVLAPSVPLAILGSAIWGAGSALIVPLAIAAAARDEARAPARVSAVTSVSSLATIAGPPLVGALADSVGVRNALIVIIAAAIVGAAVSRRAMRE